ncbi:MAG: porin family protein [Planctomycetota bacterium]|jgi:hypothetical protein
MRRALSAYGAAVAAVAAVAFACAPARAAGLTGGATAAILTGDDVELDADLDNARMGFSAGLYFAAKAPNFEFRPEILFVEMGTGDEALLPAMGAGPLEFRFDYVQVPFLFKMTSATDKRAGVGLFFGPYFAFNLEAKMTEDVGGVPVTTDIKDLVRDTDVGAIVGLSVDAKYWSLDVRYTHGFEKIFEDTSLDVRNAAVSVMLGISF